MAFPPPPQLSAAVAAFAVDSAVVCLFFLLLLLLLMLLLILLLLLQLFLLSLFLLFFLFWQLMGLLWDILLRSRTCRLPFPHSHLKNRGPRWPRQTLPRLPLLLLLDEVLAPLSYRSTLPTYPRGPHTASNRFDDLLPQASFFSRHIRMLWIFEKLLHFIVTWRHLYLYSVWKQTVFSVNILPFIQHIIYISLQI